MLQKEEEQISVRPREEERCQEKKEEGDSKTNHKYHSTEP